MSANNQATNVGSGFGPLSKPHVFSSGHVCVQSSLRPMASEVERQPMRVITSPSACALQMVQKRSSRIATWLRLSLLTTRATTRTGYVSSGLPHYAPLLQTPKEHEEQQKEKEQKIPSVTPKSSPASGSHGSASASARLAVPVHARSF